MLHYDFHLGVELAAVETASVKEELVMERMLCIRLVDVFDGLERSVSVFVEPELSGFSTAGTKDT